MRHPCFAMFKSPSPKPTEALRKASIDVIVLGPRPNGPLVIMASTPLTCQALMMQARKLSGLTFEELAHLSHSACPEKLLKSKGWLGQVVERLLGADAGSQALPDFSKLGIELKTLPLNALGQPKESTYVTYAPIPFEESNWLNATVRLKLKQVLWFPYFCEGPVRHRRLGTPFLWSMNQAWEALLRQDWLELAEKMRLQQFDELNAKTGQYLHIRPKAPNSKTWIRVMNSQGEAMDVVPKGFYLRPAFTHQLVREVFGLK